MLVDPDQAIGLRLNQPKCRMEATKIWCPCPEIRVSMIVNGTATGEKTNGRVPQIGVARKMEQNNLRTADRSTQIHIVRSVQNKTQVMVIIIVFRMEMANGNM